MKLRTRVFSAAIAIVFLCAASIGYFTQPSTLAQDQPAARADTTVRVGGVLESASLIQLRSEVSGVVRIRKIVPDGSLVKKGDLLVELDDADLQNQRQRQEVLIARAKAKVEQAKAKLATAQEESEAVIEVAKQGLAVAELDKERALGEGGELAHEVKTVQSEIAIAKNRLGTAERLLHDVTDDARAMAELRLSKIEAQAALETAESRLRLLEKFETPYQTAVLELAIAERRLELARSKRQRDESVGAMAAEVEAKRQNVMIETNRLQRIEEQIAHCKIIAPRPGTVSYVNRSNSPQARFVTEAGATVRQRQTIIRIVDLEDLRFRTVVPPALVLKLKVGQLATVQIDAFPHDKFKGKVIEIGQLPDPSTFATRGVKHYAVLLSLDDPPNNLKIGLSASIEIETATKED